MNGQLHLLDLSKEFIIWYVISAKDIQLSQVSMLHD